ncbi:MAG: hydroxymethylglutaryl-CoA reductase, degradative [Pseudomonadota bacterium]
MATSDKSRIPNFYKLSVPDRVAAVKSKGWLSEEDFEILNEGSHTLTIQRADKMIENVIGVMGLPVGLGLNFLVNDKEYVVPLVVEEPSIVAALSSAAKLSRASGGYTVETDEPQLIGQIQVVNCPHVPQARARLLQRRDQILNLANSLQAKLVARGGGAMDLEVFVHPTQNELGDFLVLHLIVNTCDAMGANLVNTMCEGVAPLVERITGGKVFLRILSNLTDRAIVRARTHISPDHLAGKGHDGEQVRDGIVIASEFARIDPYRAATHNKGVMNGIDAVALATGNDWRAIEAGAHAYAARGGRYTSLTRWSVGSNGDLVGDIEVPIKVGIVGGPLESNPTVAVNLRMMGVSTARELAGVMGAVGLGQNFSALRALATDGIQKGHMTLHARSVAQAAGATPEIFDTVVKRLIESDEIKIWKAREIVRTVHAQSHAELDEDVPPEVPGPQLAHGHGKAIIMGEHAVVYGSHAIAAPVPLAVEARILPVDEGLHLSIPRWGLEHRMQMDPEKRVSFEKPAATILEKLGLIQNRMRIEVFPNLPRAQGLGGSAAVAVAIIRALDMHYELGLSEDEVSDLAFDAEKLAHGNPSGIDNAVATYGEVILFRRGEKPLVEPIQLAQPLKLVIGMTGIESMTARMVARVREGREKNRTIYDRLFNEIDQLTIRALDALKGSRLEELGGLMNVCQGLLNSLQVSSWEVEEMVQIARESGALGAKLTGAGGGGSVIALCPENGDKVVKAIEDAGYQAMQVTVE